MEDDDTRSERGVEFIAAWFVGHHSSINQNGLGLNKRFFVNQHMFLIIDVPRMSETVLD